MGQVIDKLMISRPLTGEESLKQKGLKVALVHDFLVKVGGAEKVTQVLSEIFPEAPIYTLLWDPKMASLFPNRKIIVSSLQKFYSIFKIPTKLLLLAMPRAIEEFDFSDFDIVISSSNSFAKGIITLPKTTHISYCHSPTRYLWDAYHSYVKEQHLPQLIKFILQRFLHNLRMWDRLAADRVDYYIANSKYVKNRIAKYYRKNATVIYPPIDIPKIEKLNIQKADYFLVVSRLSAYKRIDLAIKACNELRLPLVIIGEGEELVRLKKLAGYSVEFLGWQNDRNKWEYLKKARGLIFPGEEDFGMVPVEAMAVGTPVIAYGKGGVSESVVDSKTGVLFKQQSVVSLVGGLKRFLEIEKVFNNETIHDHAKKFNTTRFKNEIIDFINNLPKSA